MSEVEIREPTVKEACSNCRFWGEQSDPAECRRRAPLTSQPGHGGDWPVTQRHQWCGDYARKPCDHVFDAEHVPDHSKPGVRQPACSKCGAIRMQWYDSHATSAVEFGRSLREGR